MSTYITQKFAEFVKNISNWTISWNIYARSHILSHYASKIQFNIICLPTPRYPTVVCSIEVSWIKFVIEWVVFFFPMRCTCTYSTNSIRLALIAPILGLWRAEYKLYSWRCKLYTFLHFAVRLLLCRFFFLFSQFSKMSMRVLPSEKTQFYNHARQRVQS